ncbi:MAG: type II toxin-antitoxin system TacA family antitoxin [Acidimicrobiales bacterium]
MPGQRTTERAQRDARLNLRTSAAQQQLIRSAAAAIDKSVTDFVLESATTNAERVLAGRRWFVLSDDAWKDFETLLDAPAPQAPKLAGLLSRPTVFDSPQ